MSSLIATGMEWLRDQLKASASVSISYHRGVDSVPLVATPGSTLLRLGDELSGSYVVRTDRDYLIPAEDLVLEGNLVIPAKGDEIKETIDGVLTVFGAFVYEGDRVFRWADQHRKILRVHTKKLRTE